MKDLSFDEGYKEFSINGDENRVIRFNPSDLAIIKRLEEAKNKISESMAIKDDIELDNEGKPVDSLENYSKVISHIDNVIKEQINYIFDSDVANVVFGNQSPLANIKGKPLYERFMESVMPEIKKAVEEEAKESRKRVAKYTKVVKW